jgi:uncharacterized protein YjbJ (UPF0337 family)
VRFWQHGAIDFKTLCSKKYRLTSNLARQRKIFAKRKSWHAKCNLHDHQHWAESSKQRRYKMVAQDKLSGSWHTIVGAIKEKFGQVTGDDLTRVQGNFDQLVGLLERKTGQTRESIEAFIDDVVDGGSSLYQKAKQKSADVVHQASDYVQQGVSQVSRRAEEGVDYARETVRSKPVESLAIVAGLSALAGLAIGFSMACRRR